MNPTTTEPTTDVDPRRWLALMVIGAAQLMVVLDVTIVNIALPSAQRSLGISNANRQWVVTAYALAFGGLLLLGGRVADFIGRKRAFIIGLIGFGVASAIGGIAQNQGELFAARGLQGAFAAVMAPAALSLITVTFTERRERARAFAVYGGISGGGAALGLILGGLLTEYASWRWTLLVNTPIAIITAVAAVLVVRESRAEGNAHYDVPGVITSTLGLVALVYGFTKAEESGWSATITVSFSSAHDLDGTGNGAGGVAIPPTPFVNGFIEMDPPTATSRRQLFAASLSPKGIARLRPDVEVVCRSLFDQVIEGGECDIANDIASPLTAIMTMRLLGVPDEEWRSYSAAAHLLLASAPGTADHNTGLAAYGAVVQSLSQLVTTRMESPTDSGDLVSVMCRAVVDGNKLAFEEMLSHATLFYLGGVDTTTNALANTVAWLGANPDRRAQLIEHPELFNSATEEFLRVFGPIPGLARTALTDTMLGGQQIRAGDRVYLMFSAANHDGSTFADPHEVNYERSPNRHVAFGMGIHRCIGSNLARMIFQVCLAEVLSRIPEYEIAEGGAVGYPSIGGVRGMAQVRVTFAPGSRSGQDYALAGL